MRTLLAVETGAVICLLILLATGAAPPVAWGVAAAIGVAGLWPIQDRPAARFAAQRLARLLRPSAPARAMSAPVLHAVEDSAFAVHRNGETVSCAIFVWAPVTGPHHPGRGAGRAGWLDIALLAPLLDRFGIALAGIDVVAVAEAPRGDGPLAAAYRSLCGPVPPTGPHTTAVLLHLDPRRCPEAIARRGGGRAGADRTVRTAAERVRRALEAAGLHAAPVDASGFRALWRQAYLAPAGADDVAVRAGWEHSDTPAGRHHVRTAAPEALTTEGLGRVWHTAAAGTTAVVRLRPGADGAAVLSAAHRHLTDTGGVPAAEPGFRLLRGAGLRGLEMTGPGPVSAASGRTPARAVPVRRSDGVLLPTGGRPVLIGGTRSGDPVALVLAGPPVSALHLAVTGGTALRLIGRMLGAGLPLAVRTDRPQLWHRFLALAPTETEARVLAAGQSPDSGCAGVVYDGIAPDRAHGPGPTRIVLAGPGDPAPPTGPGVVVIDQPAGSTELVVTAAGRKTTVVAVAVPDENRLVEQFMARQG